MSPVPSPRLTETCSPEPSENPAPRAVGLVMTCLVMMALTACQVVVFEPDVPKVSGTWEGTVGSGEIRLVLIQLEPHRITGSGFITIADTARAITVLSGTHLYPSLSLVFGSDAGELNLSGTRTPGQPLLRYGISPVRIIGEMNGLGFVHEPITLIREPNP